MNSLLALALVSICVEWSNGDLLRLFCADVIATVSVGRLLDLAIFQIKPRRLIKMFSAQAAVPRSSSVSYSRGACVPERLGVRSDCTSSASPSFPPVGVTTGIPSWLGLQAYATRPSLSLSGHEAPGVPYV